MRARWGGIGLVLLGILAGTALLVAVTPMGRYLVRGAVAEARILARRQSIARLAADSTTAPAARAKLQLVLEARRFAMDSLGLPAKDAFTQFTQLDHDTLVLVLSGAQRDWLRPVTWWFPIVGSVPYKGYFDFAEAQRAERELQDAGYDTYLRPSPAFSTLGFFNDPVLSTTLNDDSLEIVNTVIHELTHNRFYAKGHAVFNESFASFVGARGAERFFRSRGDSASARRVTARWNDDLLLGAVWERTYAALDSAFRSQPADSSRPARLLARDTIYARARSFLVDSVGPRFKTIDSRYAARVRLDNASLLARRIYATGLQDFEAAWMHEDRDVRKALERIIALATTSPKDPGAAVRAWVGAQGQSAAPTAPDAPDVHVHTPHFDVFAAAGTPASADLAAVARVREDALAAVARVLDASAPTGIQLTLYPDEESKRRQTGHSGLGWADGKTMAEVYNATIRLDPYHELAHIVGATIGHPPAFVDEGFAVYVAERLGSDALALLGQPRTTIQAAGCALVSGDKAIPLDRLFDFTELGSAASNGPVSYPQSAAVVKYLVDTYGIARFRTAFRQLRSSADPSVRTANREALTRLYGKSLAEIEGAWRRSACVAHW